VKLDWKEKEDKENLIDLNKKWLRRADIEWIIMVMVE
jgi:hypothetical protein